MDEARSGQGAASKFRRRIAPNLFAVLLGIFGGSLTYESVASSPPIEMPPDSWFASLPRTVMSMVRPSGKPPLPTVGTASSASGGIHSDALLSLPNTAVGRTAGNFSVSQNGAAVYTIPIWTPKGAHGIEPHLALVCTISCDWDHSISSIGTT
jgi:hypothetical protein